jgi:hypothetical protein
MSWRETYSKTLTQTKKKKRKKEEEQDIYIIPKKSPFKKPINYKEEN